MSNIALHNISRWCYLHKLILPSKFFTRWLRRKYACDIQPSADIADSVVFAHKGLGVVIGMDAVIGEGTKIMQNVTIGGRGGVRANPVIGKNVLIGAGAVVMGKISIGDNVKIGANAVIIDDIPDNCTAVGVPGKIVRRGSPETDSKDGREEN